MPAAEESVLLTMAAAAGDDGLKKLEYLSLISKVCSELETHLGFGDKVLAEFITDLGQNCDSIEHFDSKLKENGAQMPDYFVRTLLTIIHAILPPQPKNNDKKESGSVDGFKKPKYKALAIADGKERAKELERQLEMEAEDRRKKHENQGRDGDRDRDKDFDRDGYTRDRKERRTDREYDDHRDRRARHKDNGFGRKDFDGEREKEMKRNGRYYNHATNVREDAEGQREKDRRRDGRYYSEPEWFKVYKGRVSRVMNSACFVQLNDFRGKEGLVHVSQVASRRVGNAKDVVKKDQEVYVKVISVSGQKLSLS